MYADDLAPMSDSKEELLNVGSDWASVLEDHGLKNTKKAGVMQIGKVQEELVIDISGEKLIQKKEFVYLEYT